MLGSKSVETFFINNANELEQKDVDQARTWLLVAKTLLPRSFGIQFESYKLDKQCHNVKESAAHLERLCNEFPEEADLWAEIRVLAAALRCEDGDRNNKFLRQVFCHLPSGVQHRALSVIADRSNDTLEHCQLVLLLLKKFPDMVDGHAARVVEILITAEKHLHVETPFNKYRKFLVVDVLPSLLASKSSDITSKQTHRLFLRSVEFYTVYCTSPSTKLDSVGDSGEELRLIDPWGDMAFVCHGIAKRLGWSLGEIFTHKRSRDLVWQQIQTFQRDNAARMEDALFHKQLIYCTLAVMLQCIVEYTQRADPAFPNPNSSPLGLDLLQTTPQQQQCASPHFSAGHQPTLMLVEAFCAPASPWDPPPTTLANAPSTPVAAGHRRRRSEDEPPAAAVSGPAVTVSRQVSATRRPQLISAAFSTAVRCWQLLQSSPALAAELHRVWQCTNLSGRPWFKSFLLDAHLYLGDTSLLVAQCGASGTTGAAAAAEDTEAAAGGISDQLQLCRKTLLRAFLAYTARDHRLCGELCLRVLTGPLLPNALGDFSLSEVVSRGPHVRHVHLLAYCQADVTKYCVKLLTLALQCSIFEVGGRVSDQAIGQLAVLLQYDWPTEQDAFAALVRLLRQRSSLSYPQFMRYVTCPDIVEEFVFLSTEQGGSLQLVLMPSQQTRQRTISTRGVDKGAREEFRQAMLAQIRRCDSQYSLLTEFLTAEKDTIVRCLR